MRGGQHPEEPSGSFSLYLRDGHATAAIPCFSNSSAHENHLEGLLTVCLTNTGNAFSSKDVNSCRFCAPKIYEQPTPRTPFGRTSLALKPMSVRVPERNR